MELKILGPLEVYDATGAEIRLPAGRERALLVILLLRRGEVVSVDALIDALWGERAPSTAAKAIQGYVSHLRRALGQHERVLATQAPGYVLRVPDDALDAARFERLATDGQRALEDEDAAEALGALDAALSQWRGDALAEFGFEDFAQSEIGRLTERRLEAQEDRADALLRLGRHAGLVAELETLVRAHPERERLRGQLMLALYRAGRQADALQVFREGRRLANEVGLDPSPELRRLERSILDHDPTISAPSAAITDSGAPQRPREPDAPSPGDGRMQRRRAVLGALAVVVIGVALAAALIVRGRGGPADVAVVPPAVAVVDPATNRVTASVHVGSRPVSIAGGNGSVWVGDARDGTVTRVDTATLAAKSVGIGAPAVDVAVRGGSVWIATGGFGTVVRVDVKLAAVADDFPLGDPREPIVPAASSIAAGPEGLWVGAFDGLVQLDPLTGDELARVDLGGTPALQVALGGGVAWATTVANWAKRVGARSAEVTAGFYAGASVFPVAVSSDAVWVGGARLPDTGPGQLWKIHPVTGSQELSAPLGASPAGIAIGAGAIWVTLPAQQALVRIDPRTGMTVDTIPLGGPPEEVVVADGRIWVTVLSGASVP